MMMMATIIMSEDDIYVDVDEDIRENVICANNLLILVCKGRLGNSLFFRQ